MISLFTLSNVLFFLILFLACIISGLVGFGSNILALPFLSLFLNVKTIVPVLVLTVLANGIPRLLRQYRSIHLPTYFTMLPLAVLGGICGIHLTNILHEGWMKLLLAALMLFISIRGLRGLADKKQAKQQRHANPLFLAVPFMGGVMQAAFACGGPIFNIYILLNLRKKEEIRATQFAIGATSASIIALQYLAEGVYQGETLHFVFLLIPAVLSAYVVSELIFKQIDGQQFLRLVYIVLIFSGLLTGWQALQLL